MRYVVSKPPIIRLDLMVKKEYLPQLVGYFKGSGCTYAEEVETEPVPGALWVCLKDVTATGGRQLGDLLRSFYASEWDGEEAPGDKIYMILNIRKKGKKKDVCEDRKEADSGSESGDRGEPTGDIQPGQNGGAGGDGPGVRVDGIADSWEQPGLPDTCDGRCE